MKKKRTQLTGTDEITEVISELIALQQKLPLASFTPEQREKHTGRKLSAKSVQLFKNRVATASDNPGVIPATFDLPEFERDAARVIALLDLQDVLDKFRQSVADTLLIEGQSAVVRAATAADYVRLAATSVQRSKPISNGRKSRSVLVMPATTSSPPAVEPPPPALSAVKAEPDGGTTEAAA